VIGANLFGKEPSNLLGRFAKQKLGYTTQPPTPSSMAAASGASAVNKIKFKFYLGGVHKWRQSHLEDFGGSYPSARDRQ
jgi:hypothetical protein